MKTIDGNDWSDRRYNFSFEAIAPRIPVRAGAPAATVGELTEKGVAALLGSVVGHQLLFLLEGPRPPLAHPPVSPLAFNLSKTLRATESSIVLFAGKVLADHLSSLLAWESSEYQKGGAVGLLAYLVNRPLDQLETARREIFRKEGERVSRVDALKAVVRLDGWRGLYRHENALAPVSAILHRSVLFGLQHRLALGSSLPEGVQFALFPLLAAAGASACSFLTDKLRSAYLHVHRQRSTAVERRGRGGGGELGGSATREVLGMVGRGEVGLTTGDVRVVAVSVGRNWVLLGIFQLGQKYGGGFLGLGTERRAEKE